MLLLFNKIEFSKPRPGIITDAAFKPASDLLSANSQRNHNTLE